MTEPPRRFKLPLSITALLSAVVMLACAATATGNVRAGASRAPSNIRSITIESTPNPSDAGQDINIVGRVVEKRHRRVQVELWTRLPDQSGFQPTAATTSNRQGQYLFNLGSGQVTTNRDWYVTAGNVQSPVITQAVYAVLSFHSSDSLPTPHERLTLGGRVSPSHIGDPVHLQHRVSGRWSTIAATLVGRGSRYRFRHRVGTGPVELRAVLPATPENLTSRSAPLALNAQIIHKIKHVVIIMQENRSFDSYFGTYPGADGIPGLAGNPGRVPCLPDPMGSVATAQCKTGPHHHTPGVAPFHDGGMINNGGPHAYKNAVADIDGGSMDGFVGQAERGSMCQTGNPNCSPCTESSSGSGQDGSSPCIDAMGYHDAREIPNYWKYAEHFVLQDHMFEPNSSWSLPQHLYMVSEWSAWCRYPLFPHSCHSVYNSPNFDEPGHGDASLPYYEFGRPNDHQLLYAWTDLTYLLHNNDISWGYYVAKGKEPDCEDDASMSCAPVKQGPATPGIWNPLPSFTDVTRDNQLGDIRSLSRFFTAAHRGNLPAVSWVVPNGNVSEHPPASVSAGQTYVTGLVNTIMRSPDWKSTAIFVSWDDWGGFYDHVVPPVIDPYGYGLRVPGLVISPYAKLGYIDHHTLSHDAYNKFIEDDFLGGQRLDPNTDGRPDPRPDVRENLVPGNLINDFNFRQRPRSGLILRVHPRPGPPST